ncbi:MAG: PAS domain-containing protein, partial [Acidobacteriota bacterium]
MKARHEQKRQRAEESVRESRRLQAYQRLVESIDGIVWEADAQTLRFTFVSKQAARILGYPVEKWLTEPTFWEDHIHPDDREWAVGYCSRAVSEGRDHQFEYRMMAADGRTVWIGDVVRVVVEDDQSPKLRGFMIDITERKQAEEALRESEAKNRALLAAIPDLVFRISGDGTFLEFVPAKGFPPAVPPEEFLGRKAQEVLPTKLAQQCLYYTRRALKTGTAQTHEY